jgi:hypothetical protein
MPLLRMACGHELRQERLLATSATRPQTARKMSEMSSLLPPLDRHIFQLSAYHKLLLFPRPILLLEGTNRVAIFSAISVPISPEFNAFLLHLDRLLLTFLGWVWGH